MIRRILVALSGTRYTEAAVRYAVELAHQHGAEIAGVTDVDVASVENVGPVPIGAAASAKGLVEHRYRVTTGRIEEAIRHFETVCSQEQVQYTVHRELGEPFDHLISLWRYHDLTIAGIQGLFEYDILHKPDDVIIRLIREGVRPILAVAPEYQLIERVLIAYNGSMASAKAMKRFLQMHLWPGMKVRLVCFELEKADAEKLLADAAAYCRTHGYEPETEWIEGPAHKRLLEHAAATETDLIVMGSSGRARIFRQIMGDTALHAIRNAQIPLFLAQ